MKLTLSYFLDDKLFLATNFSWRQTFLGDKLLVLRVRNLHFPYAVAVTIAVALALVVAVVL